LLCYLEERILGSIIHTSLSMYMCKHIYLCMSRKFDYIKNDICYTRVEFPSNVINCTILKIHWEWRNTADSLLSWKSWDHTSIKCTVSRLGETKEINSNVSRIYRGNICGRTIIYDKKNKSFNIYSIFLPYAETYWNSFVWQTSLPRIHFYEGKKIIDDRRWSRSHPRTN